MKKILPIKNYHIKLIGIFIIIVAVTGLVAFSKKATKPGDDLYIRVKLSQGLWWAPSYNPPLWLIKAIQPGDSEKDLFNHEIATVLTRTYYPADQTKFPNQYDTYLTFKLATKKDSGGDRYRYKRNILSVGSPINIDLSSTTITGSIMEISKSPINDSYITKKIVLYDQYGYYSDSPLLYNNIKIGDEYSNGQEVAFKITNKYLGPRIVSLTDANGRSVVTQLKINQNIYIEADIKVKEIDKTFFFGDEVRVVPGASLNIFTQSQDFSRFSIISIN